ncbi:MAG: HDIG domain-containing protein [Bacteroidetes bacterium]|nr:HDIG domain-containing protein [Bacteroidota bacterium]MBU1117243.1 HDIG domain-containing protein [Bacteroidota bacterium]MBU1799624.1 HDIG domain-containing protein [Bacteroidota bacterium]
MFPQGESIDSEVGVNSIWIKDDLIASQTFEILKDPIVIEKERLIATNKIYPIFIKDNLILEQVLDALETNNGKLSECLKLSLKYTESQISCNDIGISPKSLSVFIEINNNEDQNYSIKQIFSFYRAEVKKIYRRGFINQLYSQIDKDTISIRDGKFEVKQLKEGLYDADALSTYLDQRIFNYFNKNTHIKNAVKEYFSFILKPNILFSKGSTKEAKKIAAENIPINIGIVNENERIVAKHDRITPEIKSKIDSYRIAKGSTITTLDAILQNLGKFMHISLLFMPLIIYLYLFRKKVFSDNLKLLLISIIILFVSFSAFLVSHIEVEKSLEFLILVPVASMLLTIVFDSRIGFYATVVVALTVAGIRGNDYILAATNIVAGGLAAYTVRDIKNRNQIFHSFLYILLGYILSILAFGFERFDSWDVILISSAYAASNAIISPALTFGLIIFVEKIFGITTELTLFELTDFNSPLLKDLANYAPGTFAHSMTIGSMVENAALKINANPILARVGAYYHDIGKTIKPEGFIENQLNNINIHENILPKESVELIREHVIGGIELAKKYKLPPEIINFIPMHHGTMVIKYFYEKAIEIYGAENVKEDDYRYPGPKPNTRETALLMLADACESAIRSMDEPTPEKIENYVNNLFKIRIQDGQLEDSPLTFRDIHKIKESFNGILISQHHKRIRYPKQEELENKSTND